MRDNIFLRCGSSGYYICFISLDKTPKKKNYLSRAQVAEREAASLLENSGFKLVGEQPEREFFIRVNGKKIPCKILADYLVRRGRRDIYMWLK